ncbi:MAG TPA: type II secretion system protein [Tepidisphaeraceae bacterium]|jgi:type II secretory pathway pseudopilin PulG
MGRRRRAFTLMELLVLIGILIVLLSIFVPYVLYLQEGSRRTACAWNLAQIRDALQAYRNNYGSFPRVVNDPQRPNGYAAFTGAFDPNPFAPDSAVSPNDVTASLWLLVRTKLITDLSVFVCPSSPDYRDQLVDANGKPVAPEQRSNFRSWHNLSYSYALPFSSAPGFTFGDTASADFALLADRNPGVLVPASAPPQELAKGNSPNHGGAGQNVVHLPGYTWFDRTPYCGVWGSSKLSRDNIYSARSAHPGTQPSSMPVDVTGAIGTTISPVNTDDSYLVPTALDQHAFSLPSTRPSPTTTTTTTTTATTQSSTTAPTTATSGSP